ncbi:F-box protein CPR1-like [Cornus florida]|uniref:F-box protein CPR1-like n=1 Tax=Cornus florida TaxID=4283 RepID=UPI00289FBC70|nr:F-box protein CPR1-like [Cornus florida]
MEMIERREEYSSFIKSLPNDVVMDILSRLPVKVLGRFERAKLLTQCGRVEKLIIRHFILCVNGAEKQLHLVNPSTRKVKRLHPPFKCEPDGGSYGFGYDALTDDYKVVHIPNYVGKTCLTTLFTRKPNCWRRIQDIPYHVTCSAPAALLNGALHWLTKDMTKIVSLNLGDEKFQVFILPEFGINEEAYLVTVVGGCHCVCVTIREFRGEWKRSSEFWVMKEYGKKESWTNLGFAIPKCQVKPLDFSNKIMIIFYLW